LVKNGSGTQTLTAASSYSGGTTLNAGGLTIGHGSALGSGDVRFAIAGAKLNAGATVTLTNNIELNANGTINTPNSFNLTASGIVSGVGSLTKEGTGTLTLLGTNTYSGGTVMTAGTVALGNASAMGTGAVSVTGNSTNLALASMTLTNNYVLSSGRSAVMDSGAFTVTMDGLISGQGNFGKQGTGMLILTKDNVYSGTTTISQGTVQLGNGGNSGDLGTGTVTNNAKLIINRGGTFSLTNLIVGTGSVEINGTATVSMGALSAANTYSGGTLVNGGTVLADGPNNPTQGTLGTGLLTINSGGRVLVTRDNATRSTSGYLLNAGGILEISNGVALHLDGLTMRGGKIAGASTLTGSGATFGSYNLDTGLLAGGVAQSSEISALAGTLNQTGGTILNIQSGATNGVDLLISGSLVTVSASTGITSTGLTKQGDGLLVLAGTNTFTDGVRIEHGVIRAGSTSAFGLNNAVTLSNRAGVRLDLNGYSNTLGSISGGGALGGNITMGSGNLTVGADSGTGSFGGVISGTGAVTKNGLGNQTFTGANTFTGVFTHQGGGTFLGNSSGPALFNGQGGRVVLDNIYGNGGNNWFSRIQMNAANQLGSNVDVTFKSTSGGNSYFILNGFDQSIGNLNMDGSGPFIIENTEGLTTPGASRLTVNQTVDGSFKGWIRNGNWNGGPGTLALTKNGAANLTLVGGSMDYTGGTIVNAGTLTLGGMVNVGQGTIRGVVTVNSGATLNYTNAPGDTYAGAHSFGWTTGQAVNVLNINGGTVGGADIANHFYGSNTGGADVFTLNMTGGELKLGGGDNPTSTMNINVLSSSNQAVISKVSANSALTIDNKATFTVANGSQDVDLLVSANLNQRNSNIGKVEKQGVGTMLLSGSNTYSGTTVVGGGVLRAGSTNALGNNSSVTLSNLAGVTLDLNGFNNRIGALSGGGSTGGNIILGNGMLTVGANNETGTYGGVISGNGGFVKVGQGRQTLTSGQLYSGDTAIYGGYLKLAVTNGPALYSDGRGGTVVLGNDRSGPVASIGNFTFLEMGAKNQLGTNINVAFNVTNRWSYMVLMGYDQEIGNLTMSGPNPDWAVIENGENTSVSGVVATSSTLTVNQSLNTTYNGYMRDGWAGGTLALTKKGAGTLTIVATNVDYTGGTKVMEGKLAVQAGSLGGSSSANQVFINTNAVLEYNLTNAAGFANGVIQKGATITGAGTLEKTGQGALIFGGSGQVNIAMDAGSWINLQEGEIKAHNCVQANWDNNKASLFINTNTTFWQVEGNVTVGALAGGGNIVLGYSWPNFQPVMKIGYGDASSVFSGQISEATQWGGKGVLTKIGKGTQTFSGTNNSITGNLTVNDGLVNFGNTGNFAANALLVGNVAGARGRVDVQTGNKITTLANADRYGVVLGDNGGAGAMYQNGGVVDINAAASINNFMIGKSSGSFGHYGLDNGYLELTEFGIGSGSGGNGVLEVRGGTIKTTDYFLVSRGDSGTGQNGMVNLLGGTIQVDNGGANSSVDLAFNAGFNGGNGKTSVLTVANDALLSVNNRGINLNYNNGNNTGILNLNGGTTKTAYIRSTDTTGNQFLNFSGGTLTAASASGNFIYGVDRVTINQGGAKFDTAGFNVTIGQSMQAPAGKGLSSVAIANGGSGYIAPPIVEISGGGGTGATGYAEIDRVTGAVTNIVISNPGNGYTTPPTVVLKQGGFITTATVGLVGLADNVSGGITKQGNGELLLSAGNTYTGATVVEKGTLKAGVASSAFGITSALVLSNVANVLVDLNGNNQTIGSLSGGGSTGGTVSLGANTLTMGTDNTSTSYAGTITGSNGQLIKTGTGNQTLAASNSYTGATTVNGGTLTLTANNALGTVAGGVTVASGATTDFKNVTYSTAEAMGLNGGTIANSSATSLFAGNITLGANSFANVTGTALTLSGAISGAYDLTKTGSGALILTGTGSQTSTTISQGTLQLGAAGTTGWVSGNVINNAALVLYRSNDDTLGGVVSGTGTLEKKGASTVTLTGANSYGGLTTITAGTLQVGNGAGVGSLGTGDVANSGVLTFNRTGSLNYAGKITGTGSLTKLAAGTVVLTGDSTFSGGTTITSGILQVGNGGTSGAIGQGAITDNAALVFKRSDAISYTGAITGTGSLTQDGAGTLSLSGANGYTGATLVNAGKLLTVGADRLSDVTAVTVAGGATFGLGGDERIGSLAGAGAVQLGSYLLTVGDASVTSFTGNMTGLGALTKVGSGSLAMSGVNTFTGDVNVDAGTLILNSSTALDRSAVVTLSQAGVVLTVNSNMTVGAFEQASGSVLNGSGIFRTRLVKSSGGELNTVIGDLVADPANGFLAESAGILKRGVDTTTVSAANTFTGDIKLQGGQLQMVGAGSFNSASSVIQSTGTVLDLNGKSQEFAAVNGVGGTINLGSGNLAVGGAVNSQFDGVIEGTGGFTQKGSGTTTLNGQSTFSGATAVDAGKLVVNGALNTAGTVTVADGAKLGGSGTVGAIGGAGLVEAGNSPGILTATQVIPTSGLDFNFELFGFNPVYSSPTNSVNDVVRLTGPTPFGSSLTAANVLAFYIDLPGTFVFGSNQVFEGGFFADQGAGLLAAVKDATMNYFIKDATGAVSYNGNTYVSFADYAKKTAGQYDAAFVLSTVDKSGTAFSGSTAASGAKVMGLTMVSTITITPNVNLVYDTNPKPATATSIDTGVVGFTYSYEGVNGTSYGPISTAPHEAGDYMVTVTTTNSADVKKSENFTIQKATATLAWSALSPMPYVTTGLVNGQLNATETHSIPGVITYSDSVVGAISAGTVLEAGGNSLTANFVPNDTRNYTTATASNTLVVNKADPMIVWGTLTAITYPAALSLTELNATEAGSVAGSMNYNQPIGTVLNAGTQPLQLTFYPTDTRNYNSVTANNTLVVNKATAVVTVTSATETYEGTRKSVVTSVNPAGLSMDVTYNGSTQAPANLGPYAVVATVTDPNYVGTGSGTLDIVWPSSSASPTITMTPPANLEYDGNAKAYTASATNPLNTGNPQLGSPANFVFEYAGVSGTTYATSANAPIEAGDYTVKVYLYSGSSITQTVGFNIAKKSLTIGSVVAASKVYDGLDSASISGESLVGVAGADVVNLVRGSGFSATFADDNVGTGKVITVAGFELGGAKAGNYVLAGQPSGLTADITKKTVTITGLSVTTKTYDQSKAATLSGVGSIGLSGEVAKDIGQVSADTASMAAEFADANAGVGKAVTLTGLALTGSRSGNYELNAVSGLTGTIQAISVTISGMTVADKVYDTNRNAIVSGGTVSGVLNGDSVQIDVSGATFLFNNKDVGAAKAVAASGVVLGGSEAINYALSAQPTLPAASITAAPLTITGLAIANKVYDGGMTATRTGTAALSGLVGGETLVLGGTVTANFNDKNIGTGKAVVVSGYTASDSGASKASNYALSQPSGLTADITVMSLTVSGAVAANREYDGTDSVQVTGGTLFGVIGVEDVQLRSSAASFADADTGMGKIVANTGFSLSGSDSGNYQLTQPTLSADITKKSLYVTGLLADNKVYDRTATATLSGTPVLSGLVSGETPGFGTSYTANFSTKEVGTGKLVTITGYTAADSATFKGSNYQLVQPSGLTADITPYQLSLSGLGSLSKAYDGTRTIAISGHTMGGKLGADDVSLAGTPSGLFNDPVVGNPKALAVTGLTLTGGDAVNYTLTSALSTTGAITAKALTVVGMSAQIKTYDGSAGITLIGGTLVGVESGDAVTLAGSGTGTCADENVGLNKVVTVTGLSLSGADALKYTLAQPTDVKAQIDPAPVTLTGMAATTRAYNGAADRSVAITGGTLNGVLAGDSSAVSLNQSGLSALYSDGNVGTAKAVTITGLTLSGAKAGNYVLVQPANVTGDISAKTLSVTGVAVANKVYDNSVNASLTGTAVLGAGVVAADSANVTLETSSATAVFGDALPGNGKAVTVSGYYLSGSAQANYSVEQPSGLVADITGVTLIISGAVAVDKSYDGNNSATVSGGALVGLVSGDAVTLGGSPTGTFNDQNVGTGKTVTVTGYALSGADAGKYSVSQPSLTANITAQPLTVTGLSALDKSYDRSTSATMTGTGVLVGKVGTEVVNLDASSATASFANFTAASGKIVTGSGYGLSGTDAGNYKLVQPTATATISRKMLTLGGLSVANKTYDRNTAATVSGTGTLVGIELGDTVTLDSIGASADFASAAAGTGKTVTGAGYLLAGADAGNYDLTQPTWTADINGIVLTISGVTADNKVYDRSATASLSGTAALIGVVSPDVVTLSTGSAVATFADAIAGTAKAVTVSGYSLGGANAANYTLVQPAGLAANITAMPLTVTGTTTGKQYDGSDLAPLTGATLQGVINGDIVTLANDTAGTFASSAVGTNVSVTTTFTLLGADKDNYSVTQPTLTGDIVRKVLTVSGAVVPRKQYDGNTTASISGGILMGVVGSENVVLDSGSGAATFVDKTVGVGKAVTVTGYTITGTDIGNYTMTQPIVTADITAAPLTVSGAVVTNKEYDSTTDATISGATLVGKIGSDVVNLANDTTGIFAQATPGTAIAVSTAMTLTGVDAGNYALSQPVGLTADITAKALTISGATAVSRTYDGSRVVVVSGGNLLGFLPGDTVTLVDANAAGTTADKLVSNSKSVTVTGYALGGANAAGYTVTQPTGLTANISKKALTVSGASAVDKNYNGNNSASITTTGLVGVISGDTVSVSGGGTFATALVGTGKAVTAALVLGGADAGNYSVIQPTGLLADITAGPLNAANDTITIPLNAAAYTTQTVSLPSIFYNDGLGLGSPIFAIASTANGYSVVRRGNVLSVTRGAGLIAGEAFRYTLEEDINMNGMIDAGERSTGVVSFVLGTDLAGTVKVIDTRMNSGNFVIVFSAMPGTKWHVQKTASLASPFWTDIGTDQTADSNGYFQITDPVGSAGSGFYEAYRVP
jgi:autotransporter-associated beta strand protein